MISKYIHKKIVTRSLFFKEYIISIILHYRTKNLPLEEAQAICSKAGFFIILWGPVLSPKGILYLICDQQFNPQMNDPSFIELYIAQRTSYFCPRLITKNDSAEIATQRKVLPLKSGTILKFVNKQFNLSNFTHRIADIKDFQHSFESRYLNEMNSIYMESKLTHLLNEKKDNKKVLKI